MILGQRKAGVLVLVPALEAAGSERVWLSAKAREWRWAAEPAWEQE